MDLNEQELIALSAQCEDLKKALGPNGDGDAFGFPHSFFDKVETVVATCRQALTSAAVPNQRIESLRDELHTHRKILEKISSMRKLGENAEAALAARSFLDSHPRKG
jgi:hypothetical protein